ncbi:M23 family metallopeptidase [Clostridium weizhouense]|uniref:M23 family metallopeptidase n=1 Tax=Clostridium weizhouense TaxID=2859781 RepID=A0ABS7AMV3_9CLOT|nr:M23 family metallopeptidase [Clostridium weizhouense]MBW6408825.1 M23 family metallopeptidase [Clostridium weizhouense]
MSDYRSEYEKYYKNIMKQGKNTNVKTYLPSKGKNISLNNICGSMGNEVKNKTTTLTTKFIRQLIASLILITLMFSFKVISLSKNKELYIVSKNIINQNITYSNVIQTINSLKGLNVKEKAEEYINVFKTKTKEIGKISVKEKIKDKYCLPVLASYMKLQGDIKGVLIQGQEGQQVVCSMDGVVRKVSNDEGCQNILIDHGDGIETYYGVLKNSNIVEGDQVKKGEYLGDCNKISGSGKNGVIFKFIYMGKEQDPTEYLDFSNLQNV